VVCGLLWFAVYNVALNAAERRIDAGIAALLVNVGPIFIAILAGLVLREGFPRLLLAGCAVAFAGAALIGISTSRHSSGGAWGPVLCIIAAATYAGGVIAQKRVLDHASPLAVTWLACVVGGIGCLPFAPQLISQLQTAGARPTLWMTYLGLAPTAIGFLTWAYALSHTAAAPRPTSCRRSRSCSAGRRSARCRRCSPCRAGSSVWPGWRWPVDQRGRPSSLAGMFGHRRLIRPAPSDPAPC